MCTPVDRRQPLGVDINHFGYHGLKDPRNFVIIPLFCGNFYKSEVIPRPHQSLYISGYYDQGFELDVDVSQNTNE